MMNEFDVKSKVYVVPAKKNYIFIIILNICVIIAAILSLFSIFGDGIKMSNISPIVIGIYVVIKTRSWLKADPYYEFSMAHVKFEDAMVISYDTGKIVTIFKPTIYSIEYSDQLECIRFVADYNVKEKQNDENYKQEELLFYVNQKENEALFGALEQFCGKQMIFVDRGMNK